MAELKQEPSAQNEACVQNVVVNGFIRPRYTPKNDNDILELDYGFFMPHVAFHKRALGFFKFMRLMLFVWDSSRPTIEVHDARKLQAEKMAKDNLSLGAFFAQYGFVLINHKTSMNDRADGSLWSDTSLYPEYNKELEALIRDNELYIEVQRTNEIPVGGESNIEVSDQSHNANVLVRRGPGFQGFADSAHNDYCLTVADYEEILGSFAGPEEARKWRKRYEEDDKVNGYAVVNFWRPTTPMKGPIKRNPLAFCDPATVNDQDLVQTKLPHISPIARESARQMAMKHNESHKWYYYPDMTTDEVLVFKSFEVCKKENSSSNPASENYRLPSCFHTSFADPAVEKDAEPRFSCECRVFLWF